MTFFYKVNANPFRLNSFVITKCRYQNIYYTNPMQGTDPGDTMNGSNGYDVVVIGGGVAGLFTAYQIHKKNPQTRVLLLEKEHRLGGRIYTYKDPHMTVEAGAGRFNGSHRLVMNLVDELGLASKRNKNNGNVVFRPAVESKIRNGNGESLDTLRRTTEWSPGDCATGSVEYSEHRGAKTLPNAGLIQHLVAQSASFSKQYLQHHTLSQYASQVLTKRQVQYIQRSFGYYSELVIMNAYDAIKLLDSLGPNNTFYGLKGGLEQIITRMETIVRKNPNIHVLKHTTVTSVVYKEPVFYVCTDTPDIYECKICVCALPKPALLALPIFKSIRPVLNKITCGTLCRIYTQYDRDHVWFRDIERFTTDNDLRMVIPYNRDEGTIMISYSDHRFADKWEQMYREKGVRGVNRHLREQMLESTGIRLPRPTRTKVFYWACGVGYWGIGADSKMVAERMIQPFPDMPLFVCGENYSEHGQQWIEGALETSTRVFSRIRGI